MVDAHAQLPREHYDVLVEQARLNDRSIAAELRRAVREYVNRIRAQGEAAPPPGDSRSAADRLTAQRR